MTPSPASRVETLQFSLLPSRYPSTHMPSTRGRPALLPRIFCTRLEADQPIYSLDASARADRSRPSVSQAGRNHLYDASPFPQPGHHISFFAFTRLGRIRHCFPPPASVLLLYGFSKEIVECPVSSVIYATGDLKGEAAERLSLMPASYGSSQFQKNRKHPLFHLMNKFKSNANSYAKGICDHVSLGSTVSQTVKGKLSLGMRIIQAGGIGRFFRQNFSLKGEKLLNAFQCYLSTTAGPIRSLTGVSSMQPYI